MLETLFPHRPEVGDPDPGGLCDDVWIPANGNPIQWKPGILRKRLAGTLGTHRPNLREGWGQGYSRMVVFSLETRIQGGFVLGIVIGFGLGFALGSGMRFRRGHQFRKRSGPRFVPCLTPGV